MASILQRRINQKEPKYLSKRVCTLTIGEYGTNAKKLRNTQKFLQYYTINGLIRLRIEKSGLEKVVTHILDQQNLPPDI